MSEDNQVPASIKNLDSVVWLRLEFEGQWGLLVSREEQAEILGTTPEGVSTRCSTYPAHAPQPVVRYGSREWRVRSEVIDFGKWMREQRDASAGKNQGKKIERSVEDKAKSEIVRLTRRIEALEGHKLALQVKLKEKTVEINRAKIDIVNHQERLELIAREKAARIAEARALIEELGG